MRVLCIHTYVCIRTKSVCVSLCTQIYSLTLGLTKNLLLLLYCDTCMGLFFMCLICNLARTIACRYMFYALYNVPCCLCASLRSLSVLQKKCETFGTY